MATDPAPDAGRVAAAVRDSDRPVPRLVAVDGRVRAGKSTFARTLAAELDDAPVLSVDGFLFWGTLHDWWDRFEREALAPLAEGRSARFRVRDWAGDPLGTGLAGWHEIAPAEFVVVEGVGCARRAAADRYAAIAWVEAPRKVRLRRGLDAYGRERLPQLVDWLAREEEFFARDPVQDRANFPITGGDFAG